MPFLRDVWVFDCFLQTHAEAPLPLLWKVCMQALLFAQDSDETP